MPSKQKITPFPLDAEKAKRVGQAMLGMTKLDIEGLKCAADQR